MKRIEWDWYRSWLEAELNTLGYSLSKPQQLAKAILDLSDLYQKPNATPWKNPGTIAAYLTYFMPLNLIRQQAVLEIFKTQGPENFHPHHVLDFGSGAGTTEWSFIQSDDLSFTHLDCIEISEDAIRVHKKLSCALRQQFTEAGQTPRWLTSVSQQQQYDLGVFQTSLNEISDIPDALWQCQTLIFIEPATSHKARPLMALREPLLKNNYHIWAPCTHHEACPLLIHSQKDWCHDRTPAPLPAWLVDLQKYLPINNDNLNFSYLIASLTPASRPRFGQARIVGDALWEKGKVRQLICRSSEREFVSWLRRKGDPLTPHRGDLVDGTTWPAVKSEIRLDTDIKVIWSRYK